MRLRSDEISEAYENHLDFKPMTSGIELYP